MKGAICFKEIASNARLDLLSIHCKFLLFINCDRFHLVVVSFYRITWYIPNNLKTDLCKFYCVISVKFYPVVIVKIIGCEFLSDSITYLFRWYWYCNCLCKFSLFGLTFVFGNFILFAKTNWMCFFQLGNIYIYYIVAETWLLFKVHNSENILVCLLNWFEVCQLHNSIVLWILVNRFIFVEVNIYCLHWKSIIT